MQSRSTLRLLFALAIALSSWVIPSKSFSQSIINPADPIVEYNPDAPPTAPGFGKVGKWVRTKRLNWNTDSYKAYIIDGYCFRLKFPKTYDPTAADGKKYPMVVMFHGKGERGPNTDNEYQLLHGGEIHRNAVDNGAFDGYVLFMQNTYGSWGSAHFNAINKVVNYMVTNNKLDINRLVFHGLSAGGQGTWTYLNLHSKNVAAALPMSWVNSEYADPAFIAKYKYTPIWLFQGGRDTRPRPATANFVVGEIRNAGGNITYTLYPNTGHGTWYAAYAEPDFFPFISRAHKANPWVLGGKSLFCQEATINVTIGLTPGFDGYEWRKNGQLINGANTNTIQVTDVGVYDARIKRGTEWSVWSPQPVTIAKSPVPAGPAISLPNNQSVVLPSPDGKNNVTMHSSDGGGGTFAWYKLNENIVLSTKQEFNTNKTGDYVVKTTSAAGCITEFSAPFRIVDANGPNKPGPASALQAFALSQTSVRLDWTQQSSPAYNETGFEVFRSLIKGTQYKFVTKVPQNQNWFVDNSLNPNTKYFYIVRAVNGSAAGNISNEASVTTTIDNTAPSTPQNLTVTGTRRDNISFSWSASSDNIAVTGYDIYQNGTKVGTSTTTSYNADGLVFNNRYAFYVIAKDAAGNHSGPSAQVSAFAINRGLNYKYYHGTWSVLPDFNALTPIKSGWGNNISLAPRIKEDNFGFLWEGSITITNGGNYVFRTNSDDGSKLYLSAYSNGATPLVNNDGLHGGQDRDGSINLAPGVYPIAITFFERTGGQAITVSWKTPGSSSFVPIPNEALVEAEPAGVLPPAPPSNLNASTHSHKAINLSWIDNSSDEGGFELFRATNQGGPWTIAAHVASNTTNYQDTGLLANTTYYYKIRATSPNGESAYDGTVPVPNATTMALPLPPAAPVDLNGTLNGLTRIVLTWTGLPDISLKYEVFKSINGVDYFKIATLPGANGCITYGTSDESITPNTNFSYKVRAVNDGGASDFSNIYQVTSGNTSPVVIADPNIGMRYDAVKQVVLKATDADNDQLTFAGVGLPAFANLVSIGDGTATITFNPTIADQGNFSIQYTVTDPFGGSANGSFNLNVSANYPPVIANPAGAVSVDENQTASLVINATDQDGDPITWSGLDLPPYASLANISGNSVTLNLAPRFSNQGSFVLKVIADDGKFGQDTVPVSVIINNIEPGQHFYVNFNNSTSTNQGGFWNNTSVAPVQNLTLSNLKDEKLVVSPLSLKVISVWTKGGSGTLGTSNTVGAIYPLNVVRTAWYTNGYSTKTLELAGLDAAFKYTLKFFGSRTSVNPERTKYTINGVTKELATGNNNSQTADFLNIAPDLNGKISFSFAQGTGSGTGYLNAMEIISLIDDGTTPIAPDSLLLTGTPSSVILNWKDMAYNEERFDLYRTESLDAGFTKVGTVTLNGNTYTDLTVKGNKKYYYYVAAVNSYGENASLMDSIITPNQVPVIQNPASTGLRVNTSKQVNIIATDGLGEQIILDLPDLPAFASFAENGNGTGVISLNPATADEGSYAITILAQDEFGGVDTAVLKLYVGPADSRKIMVNFNTAASTNEDLPYNNLSVLPSAGLVRNLNDDVGDPTGISMTFVDKWSISNVAGGITGDNSGYFTDKAMKTGISENVGTTRTIRFSNMPAGKKYTIFVFSSRSGYTDNRNTTFTIGGQSFTVNASGNINNTIQFNEIKPDVNNQVVLTVTRPSGNVGGIYLNAIGFEILDDDGKPTKPSFLKGIAKSKTSVGLTWKDNAASETGYRVYRANTAAGPFTPIADLPVNSTAYTDNGLSSNTTYYYEVEALGSPLNSDLSNIARVTTLLSKAYINFNQNNPAPAPWNNTNRIPQDGDVLTIKDDQGANTGIKMTITDNFEGVNPYGMNTGNNSGVFPDAVISVTYWVDAGQLASLNLDGLDPNKRYNLTFFGSRQVGTGVTRISDYVVNDTTRVSLDAANNIMNTVTVYNVKPNIDGEANIDIMPSAGQSYAYIGALVIESYTPPADAPLGLRLMNNNSQLLSAANRRVSVPEKTTIAAFPNPFTGNINLEVNASENMENAVVSLYDISGKLLYQKMENNIQKGRTLVPVDLSTVQMKKGIFILQITDNKQFRKTLKVVKQ